MKKPIKINTNRASLNSDEIKQHQNFKNIWQKQYLKPKPFYKNPKFFGGVIIILILSIVVILETFEKKVTPVNRINSRKQTPVTQPKKIDSSLTKEIIPIVKDTIKRHAISSETE
jgi:hypothetical protein